MAIALDLEDLGMQGQKGEELLDYAKLNAATNSTSRGRVPNFKMDSKEALLKRVLAFLGQSDRFIKFNRPLFYEFTHLIFYATDYGNKSMSHSENIFQSINHIGMLTYLDNDIDLLAEVCLRYLFLKRPAPEIWVKACESGLKNIDMTYLSQDDVRGAPPADDYHIYFVNSWLMCVTGKEAFQEDYKNGVPIFTHRKKENSTLSKIFQVLHPIILESPKRSSKPLRALDFLSVENTIHLKTALSLSPNSDDFFRKLTNGHMIAA